MRRPRKTGAGALLSLLLLVASAGHPEVAHGIEPEKLLYFVAVFIGVLGTMLLVPKYIVGISGLLKWKDINYEQAMLFTVLAYAGGLLTMLAGLIVLGQWVVGITFTALMGVVLVLYFGLATLWARRGFGLQLKQAFFIALTTGLVTLACGAALIYLFIFWFGSREL